MKAHDAADILAKVVAAFTAGGTASASHRPIHHDLVDNLEAGDASTDRGYFAGGFGANNDRQLPLCERHPTEAPKVEVIERHSLDTDLDLAFPGRRRRRDIGKLQLAVGD